MSVFAKVSQWLQVPVFIDEAKMRTAVLLRAILLAALLSSVVYIIFLAIAAPENSARIAIISFFLPILLITWSLVKNSRVRGASYFLLFTLWGLLTLASATAGGVRSVAYDSFLVFILVAGLLLGRRAGIGFALLSVATGAALLWAERNAQLPELLPYSALSWFVAQTLYLFMVTVLLRLALSGLNNALNRAHHSEQTLRQTNKDLEHQAAELNKLNRAYRVLSDCNQTLIRATDENTLLQDVCQIIIEKGGYRLAWVGLTRDDAAKSIHPVAQAGFENGYLETLHITWADSERGRGPTGTAVRTGQIQIARHISTNPDFKPWRAEATKRGYASSVSLPMLDDGKVIGALNIYAVTPDAFDARELFLLQELTGDLAFGIHVLRTRELAAISKQLQELNRLKTKFVSDVSHELRTPVTNFKLHLDLLEHGRQEKQSLYIAILKQQANRLQQLIEDILDISRLDTAETEMTLDLVDLTAVAEHVVLAARPRATAANLKIRLETGENRPLVLGDFSQLAQVATNLVANAINYTPVGTITVRVYSDLENNQVCLAVQDTGTGIQGEDQPYLFDRFYRGYGAASSDIPGTGLGLAIVKEIVDQHHGHIKIESVVGQGSTFNIWLPLAPDD
jgi:signal transduction histidine kinase